MSEARTKGAAFSLGVLTLINLFNYLDRYIVAGVIPRVQAEFGINNAQAGALGTVFVIVYMAASPVGGVLGDRIQRRHVVAGSVFLWSLATVGSGLAGTFVALLAARAVLGVGEAGYGAVGPAIIADLFPRDLRTRMLSVFFTALPVGAALGYLVGGAIGAQSWRLAFFIGGGPGVVLALLMLFTPEPARGATEQEPVTAERLTVREGLERLKPNRIFQAATAGLTAVTFAMGGLGYWMPKFLEAERGMDPGRAGFLFGGVTAVAGLGGTILGGVLGDRAERRAPGGGLWVSAVGMIAGAPFMVLAATVSGEAPIYAMAFVAMVLLFMNTAPLNAAIVNSVPPSSRAFAVGLSNLALHALGDALSPFLIGAVADASSVAMAIRANALPVIAGGLVLLWAARQAARRAAQPVS